MLSKSSALIIILLTLLLAMTSWYAVKISEVMPFSPSSMMNRGVITNGHLIQTDNSGRIQYSGNAQSISEQVNGVITLLHPDMTFFNNANTASPWLLNADRGEVNSEHKLITLFGHVNLSRASTPYNAPVLIQTDQALLNLGTNLITGSDLLTLSQPGTIDTISGTGFIADIKAKSIKLLSNVQSRYEQ